MTSFAAGVTVFKRTAETQRFLESIDVPSIDTVYVADNGDIPPERWEIYEQDWPFSLEVLDLEYDSGLGYGREQIVEATSEEYLLIADNDMVVPSNVELLREQLEKKPDYGGISGILLEDGRIRSGCWDLYERGLLRDDDVITLDIREPKPIERVAEAPLATFDFITNAAVFRVDCLEDYCWHPDLIVEEHLDFYIGHMKRTDWQFGVCPAVLFKHLPGDDEEYTTIRSSDERVEKCRRKSLDRWGYRKRIYIKSHDWISTMESQSISQEVQDAVQDILPSRLRILYDDVVNGRYRPKHR